MKKTADGIDDVITVGELITVLQGYDSELPVWLQGCDCEGPCEGAESDRGEGEGEDLLLLTRSDG